MIKESMFKRDGVRVLIKREGRIPFWQLFRLCKTVNEAEELLRIVQRREAANRIPRNKNWGL